MKFVKADELSFDPRPQMGRIFAEGFYHWLNIFSSDRERLARAFAHIFDLSVFFAAVEDSDVAAVTACAGGKKASVHFDKKTLRRELGFVRGSFAYIILKKHLEEHNYPFELSPNTGSIEFVAASPEYRRRGAAYGLIDYIMKVTAYSEYVLEVADTSTAAAALYEKLGFKEFKRVKDPDGKHSGVNYFVYMKKERGGGA